MVIEIIENLTIDQQNIDFEKIIFKTETADVIDLDNSADLWLFIKTLTNGGAKKLLLSLQDLEFIDSAGISILIKIAKLLRAKKGDLALTHISPRIDMIFKPVELKRFIKMFDDENDALHYLRFL